MRNALVAAATVAVLALVVVLLPGTLPPELRRAIGTQSARLGEPPPVGKTGSYRFMQHQPGDPDAPVSYDPCKVIRVRINPDGIHDQARMQSLVLSAMRRISTATGLRLEYDGRSTARPRWRTPTEPFFGGPRPVLISFADGEEMPELKGQVAGVGGSTAVRQFGVQTYITGQATLDVDTFNELLDGDPARPRVARALVMHELAHVVGLAHVSDPHELMYSQNRGQRYFGPGDLRGLALLGRGECL